MNQQIDSACINTIRLLAVDAIQKANSGHPGLPLGVAPMAYVLWTRLLKHDPLEPEWSDRDRFILSPGHGSALLYSLLHLCGYDITLDDLQHFRQTDSHTPGHPEYDLSKGIEMTTGPLGQGFASAVGMAITERSLAAHFNQSDFEIISHYTYVITGDGDLMEGVTSEAASLAGHLKLGRLICLYDDNQISLAGSTELCFSEDREKRFVALGWHCQTVEDGNNCSEIEAALRQAQAVTDKPSLILIRTHIGYGSPTKQDSSSAHGSPLGEEEVAKTKAALGWPMDAQFFIPQEVTEFFTEIRRRGADLHTQWLKLFNRYKSQYPELAEEFQNYLDGKLPLGWEDEIPVFPADPKGMATRVASGKVLNAIAPMLPLLIGGSADLNPSTNTVMWSLGDFQPELAPDHPIDGAVGPFWSYAGRNIHFGVREFAMGAVINGMALHGLLPFGATFLTFSDYIRPAIRLAAMMKLHVIYIFTHDSLAVGEDGPTHQPVEQLEALRSIPDVIVIRPSDSNETAEAWKTAISIQGHPVALILSRQNLPTLDRTFTAPAVDLQRGGYILVDSQVKPEIILIASGSEVHLALGAREKLHEQGIPTRVVSMPSCELFDAQPEAYRNRVLPPAVTKRISIEAGRTRFWRSYVGDSGVSIGIDRFGASGPGDEIMKKYGMSIENVLQQALALLQRS